jgi:signal transduction histidine kinase
MVTMGFAVEHGRRLNGDYGIGVRPWIPRLLCRTRGCERRLRFIERQVAVALSWGGVAWRNGYVAWSRARAPGARARTDSRGRGRASRPQRAARVLALVGEMETHRADEVNSRLAVDESFVVQRARDAVLGLDGAGRVWRSNDAAAELLGCSHANLAGCEAASLLVTGERAAFASALARAKAGDDAELVSRLRDGTSVRLALRHAAPHRCFTLLISRERPVPYEGILAAIGHELRSPLSVTLGWLQLLLADGHLFDDRAMRGLRAIERSARLQQRLVDDILDVARIGSGKMKVELVPLDLSQQCEVAVAAFEPKAHAAGIHLEASVAPGLLIAADDARVQQLLQNLLENAIKFTPRGGHVEFTLTQVKGHAELVVADDGRGIDAALLPRIFDPYEQGERRGGRSGGLGLGLAIAKRISELHHGELTVESAGLGCGATFTWRLMLKPQPPA